MLGFSAPSSRSELRGEGPCGLDVSAVPQRRLDELARYGTAARAGQLKKHPPALCYATLLAAVARLRAKTIDDALDLLDLLMVTELAGGRTIRSTRPRSGAGTVGVIVSPLHVATTLLGRTCFLTDLKGVMQVT